MTSLQGPGRQNSPEPFADLVEKLRTMQGELNDVASSLLRSAGISVSPEGMTVDRALSILGTLDVSGDATFSGDMRIEGTLSLPAGIIDNEALANPVKFAADYGVSESFGTPNSVWTEVGNATIVIPQGMTRLQFTAAGMVNVINSTASTQNVYVRVQRQIAGAGTIYHSPLAQVALPAGFTGAASAIYIWNEAVNPAESHRFSVNVWTSAALGANVGNYARVDVAAMFTR